MGLGKEFYEDIKKRPLEAVLIGAVLGLCYAKQIFSLDYFIDMEVLVNYPGSYYNWLNIGRFGLVLQKIVLGLSWYNPYFEALLFLLALWGTGLFAGFLIRQAEPGLNRALTAVFSLVILIHPNYADQFQFRYQALEVVLGIWLLLLGSYGFVRWLRTGSRIAFGLSLIPLVISYGTYQSTVNMQITIYLGLFLFWIYGQGEEFKTVRRFILGAAAHFLLSFSGYFLLIKLFFEEDGYLSEKILWSAQDGIWLRVRSIFSYLWSLLLGGEASYSAFFTVVFSGAWILSGAALLFLIRKKGKILWYICGIAGLAVSPVFLAVFMGGRVMNRAQLMLPLASGLLWLFACHSISDYLRTLGKERLQVWSVRAGLFLGIAGLYLNMAPAMRLIYSFDVVRRADMITAGQIIDDLAEFPSAYAGKPVVFIGYRSPLSNAAAYSGEQADSYMVQSIFQYDYDFEPYSYYSTCRILNCFETMGYHFSKPEREMIPAAGEAAEGMVCWPLEGSIQELDDFIVVKLR